MLPPHTTKRWFGSYSTRHIVQDGNRFNPVADYSDRPDYAEDI